MKLRLISHNSGQIQDCEDGSGQSFALSKQVPRAVRGCSGFQIPLIVPVLLDSQIRLDLHALAYSPAGSPTRAPRRRSNHPKPKAAPQTQSKVTLGLYGVDVSNQSCISSRHNQAEPSSAQPRTPFVPYPRARTHSRTHTSSRAPITRTPTRSLRAPRAGRAVWVWVVLGSGRGGALLKLSIPIPSNRGGSVYRRQNAPPIPAAILIGVNAVYSSYFRIAVIRSCPGSGATSPARL